MNFYNNFTGPTPGNGGGVHITGPGDMNILGGVYMGNVAVREGGGLWNGTGIMNVEGITVSENTASGNGPNFGGGGVFNNGGELNISASTIARNFSTGMAGNGGGVHNIASGRMTLTTTTISENSSVSMAGGVYNNGTMSIVANTIVMNTSESGGGIVQGPDAMNTTLNSSIVALNTSMDASDLASQSSAIQSTGFNLIGQLRGMSFISSDGDLVGNENGMINPMVDTLADNGGPTMTHALLCGSPAIGAGDPGLLIPDQRGLVFVGMARDIGAYNRQDTCIINSTNSLDQLLHGSLIYPNPATNQVSIDIPSNFGEAIQGRIIEVSTGKIVQYKDLRPGLTNWSIGSLISGNYIVQIITDAGVANHTLTVIH